MLTFRKTFRLLIHAIKEAKIMTQPINQPHSDPLLTLHESGEGRPVWVLHGGGRPTMVDHFTADHHVLTPMHPGWDDTPRPDRFTGVGEVADFYLDLVDDHDLRDMLVLGSSFSNRVRWYPYGKDEEPGRRGT